MLGIVGALPGELRPLLEQLTPPGVVTRLSDRAQLVRCGVGPKRVAAAARLLLAQGATALVSWGCAGALDPRLKAGDLLLPERVLTVEGQAFPVSADWQQRLYKRLDAEWVIYTEPLVSSGEIIAEPAAKRQLGSRLGALAVDMESAAVGDIAQQAGVPFLVVRAVADTLDMKVPKIVLKALDPFGRVRVFVLLRESLLNPGAGVALLRLNRSFRAAQATLAGVVRQVGSDLSVDP